MICIPVPVLGLLIVLLDDAEPSVDQPSLWKGFDELDADLTRVEHYLALAESLAVDDQRKTLEEAEKGFFPIPCLTCPAGPLATT